MTISPLPPSLIRAPWPDVDQTSIVSWWSHGLFPITVNICLPFLCASLSFINVSSCSCLLWICLYTHTCVEYKNKMQGQWSTRWESLLMLLQYLQLVCREARAGPLWWLRVIHFLFCRHGSLHTDHVSYYQSKSNKKPVSGYSIWCGRSDTLCTNVSASRSESVEACPTCNIYNHPKTWPAKYLWCVQTAAF